MIANTSARIAVLAALPLLWAGAAAAEAAPRPPCTVSTASCLQKIGRLYVDALISHDGSRLPLAPNVRRTENALTNAQGPAEVRESFARTTMVKGVRDVRSYADAGRGAVVFFFVGDIDLGQKDVSADGTTRAGGADYKTSVTVPAGTYSVHEAERFKIVKGLITEIEIMAHVENGIGMGSGWPESRNAAVAKK